MRESTGHTRGGADTAEHDATEDALRQRLGALRELVGLSRTRLDAQVLAEAGRVLDEAAARRGLPRAYTTVALAGATGSGKSSLFNALTEAHISETGMRRPTTAAPVSCTWQADGMDGADGLLDRLGIAPHARHRRSAPELSGLVLLDLPDHDSVARGHREQVDRMLGRVDAVVWVVDPEKYADAVLHERYLRRLAGHAEVTFVVLNQKDRLTGDAVDAVLDDLRRLLDDDGMALGEHGEPGACVLSASALTGEGVGELREELGGFAATRRAAALRLTADLDGAMDRLRPVYAEPGPGPFDEVPSQGLTDAVREEFEDRLALAVGASAVGQAAERAWLRHAERASDTPWTRLRRWRQEQRTGAGARRPAAARPAAADRTGPGDGTGGTDAVNVAEGAEAADASDPVGPRDTVDGFYDAAMDVGTDTAVDAGTGDGESDGPAFVPVQGMARAARPVLAQAVRTLADQAARGLPEAWARNVRDTTRKGSAGLPEALDEVLRETRACCKDDKGSKGDWGGTGEGGCGSGGEATGSAPGGAEEPRLPWRSAVLAGQGLLLAFLVLGVLWMAAAVLGAAGAASAWPFAAVLIVAGAGGGPALAALCRVAARGPARAYGQEEERRLRRLAAGCGRSRVLEPVAAELVRYREVREQYAIAAGAVTAGDIAAAREGALTRASGGVIHN